jgi:hypothetical protein
MMGVEMHTDRQSSDTLPCQNAEVPTARAEVQTHFWRLTVNRNELRLLGGRLLEQSRALRAAFPDRGDMKLVAISDVQRETLGNDPAASAFCAALEHLRTEMVFVRDGKTHDLTVMDDESTNVERGLPLM